MTSPIDGELTVSITPPEPGDKTMDDTKCSVDLPIQVATMMLGHMANGAQRQADSAQTFGKILELDYVEGKNGVSSAEAVGERRMDESGSGKSRNTLPSGV